MFCEEGRYVFTYPGMAVVADPVNLRRPPNEARSLILQATIGCPWNRCVFCGNYQRKTFYPRYPDIKEDVRIAQRVFGKRPRRIFLADANSIVLKTEWLVDIAETCYEAFPQLERISLYGGARFILKKGVKHMQTLHTAGVKKIYVGLETGDDEVLMAMHKGATSAEMGEAAKIVTDAGMELSVTVIPGLGGQGSWERNAKQTSEVLNTMQPQETRLHNLVVHPDSRLYEKIQRGEFHETPQDEVLMETRALIQQLEIETEIFTYSSNYLRPRLLDGRLPRDRDYMLDILNFALTAPDRNLYLQPSRII